MKITKSMTLLIASVAIAAPLSACSTGTAASSASPEASGTTPASPTAASPTAATPSPTGSAALGVKGAGPMEKCFGVAKAGRNDCANLSGSHSCAGQAKTDNSPDEWTYVAKGTCLDIGGMTAEMAKKKNK